jgi:hypothetical protein
MKENAHSIRVAKILMNFGGIKMLRWNLSSWLVHDEEIVQFIVKTATFHGVFSISISDNPDMFHTGYRDFNWDDAKTTDVRANDLPTFIEWLVNPSIQKEMVKPVEGTQAPQDEQFPCSPSR